MIGVVGLTEYYAKKRGVELAIKYFQRYNWKMYVDVKAEWNSLVEVSESDKIEVRREVLSHFYGYNVINEKPEGISILSKDEIIELWELLKVNQKDKIIGNGKKH